MDERSWLPGLTKGATLKMRDALADVLKNLREDPASADQFTSLGALLEMLDSLLANDPRKVDLAGRFLSSASFRWLVADFILSFNHDYSLGSFELPSGGKKVTRGTTTIWEKNERGLAFDEQKEKLFEIADLARKTYPPDVYALGRDCSDFFFVDEMEFYGGGAGCLCADTRETRIATSLEEAKCMAMDYVRKHIPPIDYPDLFENLKIYMCEYTPQVHDPDIFEDLRDYMRDPLWPEEIEFKSIFPDPKVWIGGRAFTALLQKTGISLERFETNLDDMTGENDWLRPFVRVSCERKEVWTVWNQIHFDLEQGCSWRMVSEPTS